VLQSSAYLTVTFSLTLCVISRTGSGRLGRQLMLLCHSSHTRFSLWRNSGLRQSRARTSMLTQYSTFTRYLIHGSANFPPMVLWTITDHTHTDMHACIHARMHAHTHACTHARTLARMHACTHATVFGSVDFVWDIPGESLPEKHSLTPIVVISHPCQSEVHNFETAKHIDKEITDFFIYNSSGMLNGCSSSSYLQ